MAIVDELCIRLRRTIELRIPDSASLRSNAQFKFLFNSPRNTNSSLWLHVDMGSLIDNWICFVLIWISRIKEYDDIRCPI